MKKNIPENIIRILDEVKVCLQRIYGDKLKDIILHGSYARGDCNDGSDIDLIIILEDITGPMQEREKYFDAIWKLDLKYDTVISIIPLKEDEYRTRRLPVILNARREGIPI